MKLHLGCGTKKIGGYVNIDIRPDVNPDLIDDISKLNNIPNESVDVIYACHVLEHFGRYEFMDVLKRWFEVLKKGGILRLSVPDFEKVNEYYNETKDLSKLIGFLYGGQTYKENFHYYTWDFNSLQKDLKSINFSVVNRFDWTETDHSDTDDFSQAYLPHMDKKNGKLMSLNVEAIK
jgi:ubiquinone/menaquinone biosynthesis C-methylase UbiE